jgi:predicted nucleic acid-binding Zn ribbon protein
MIRPQHTPYDFLVRTFDYEPKTRGVLFQYGFLAALLALPFCDVLLPSAHLFRRLVLPVMLLLNHLAFQFRWPRGITIALRVTALSCYTVLGGHRQRIQRRNERATMLFVLIALVLCVAVFVMMRLR